jgi:hypothetical protein
VDFLDRVLAVPLHVWIGWIVMFGVARGLTIYIARGSAESTRSSFGGCVVFIWIILGGSLVTWLLPEVIEVLNLFGGCVEGPSCQP